MQAKLLTVEEAETAVLASAVLYPPEICPVDDAAGRVLRQDVVADRDLPPFDRVTMDGIAVSHAAWLEGRRDFALAFTQAAGQPERRLGDPAACVRVMTGAMLPPGTDMVVPREYVTFQEDERAGVDEQAPAGAMKFVHPQGVDAKRNDVLLAEGILLQSHHLMIAASVGCAQLQVSSLPQIAVVTNGDELVPVEEAPGPHQVRSANAHALCAALRRAGVSECKQVHFPDDRNAMQEGVARLLDAFDVLLLSGGVSAGDFDFMPEVLEALGVQKVFHRVQQRPGKPFWFGMSRDNKPVFALPGNPVSTLVCFHRYVAPWLRKSLGTERTQDRHAVLAEDVTCTFPLTYFLQVAIEEQRDGTRCAHPAPHHGSGDYTSLAGTHGFVEIPHDIDRVPAGSAVRYFPWM